MTAGSAHRLSIDLAAELRKITQEQHLNRVHYLVQLVRHALTHHPRAIRIRSTRGELEFIQDGDPFNPEEWRLLQAVLLPGERSGERLQEALSLLEKRHGVAILSLLLNHPAVEIRTAGHRLNVEAGTPALTGVHPPVSGYAIRLRRARPARREERHELVYFCAGAAVPIIYNDRPINAPIPLESLILPSGFAEGHGAGAVGIPPQGDLNVFHYFKQGVRFGLKRFLPASGRVLRGYWNSSLDGYESDFQESIRRGETALKAHADDPYRAVAERFPTLPPEQQERIKRIVLGLDPADWLERWGGVPLFHSCRRNFALSARDLLGLRDRFTTVPYCLEREEGAPPYLPRLLPEDAHFLGNVLGLPLRVYQARRRPW